jgi:beta-phosphoglucomutase-like phosphatase (HAD superfamily)
MPIPQGTFDGVIFDCDGTLADTMPLHYRAWCEALAENGAEMPEALFYELGGVPTAEIARTLNARYGYALPVEATVVKTLAALGIQDCFDAILTAEDVARAKPEPDLFLAAAERLGVRPERCIVYEDSPLGLEAARRAGMQSVDVRPWIRR